MDYRVEILRDMAESLAKLADETIDSPNTKTDALRSMSESLDELANGGGGGASSPLILTYTETRDADENLYHILSETWQTIADAWAEYRPIAIKYVIDDPTEKTIVFDTVTDCGWMDGFGYGVGTTNDIFSCEDGYITDKPDGYPVGKADPIV